MGVGRNALLWSSRNTWLREQVPRLPFVRRAVLRFMPGESLDSALDVAREFGRRGLPTTFTHLGENVDSQADAGAVVRHYMDVLDRVAEAGVDSEISVKPTHLGLDLDPGLASDNLLRLARAASERRNWLWIDMESSAYVEGTLQLYRRALEASPNVGVCLQAYLRRTANDIEQLLPLTPSIRLVKGAYREPAGLAFGKKAAIDRNYLELSERLLAERGAGRLRRFTVATHDLGLVSRVAATATAAGLPPNEAYEVQMLYGIRQADQFGLAASGQPTRCLVAYGPAWYPWYMRRLAERPANVGFVLRNLFSR